MFRHMMRWLMVAFLAQLLVAGAAFAQADDSETGPSDLTSGENLSLIDEDIESLSEQQKLDRAASKIKEMRNTESNIAQLLERVRDEERDILKINCINEKHAAIKGFVKISEQGYVNLQEAVDKGDGTASTHHYTLISVAHQKVQTLSEEARLCTGEEQRFAGRSQVDVTRPDDGVDDVDGPEDDFTVEDLPELTPFQ